MKLLTLTFILFITQFAQAKNNCWIYLADSKGIEVASSTTENFIAFLDVMMKERVINDDYLEKLAKGELNNPIDKKNAFQSEHHIYTDLFQEFIDAKPDRKLIADWATQNLTKNKNTQQSKAQAKQETQQSSIPMQFSRVEPGSFIINKNNPDKPKYNVTLTEPFELMKTSVTQKMWIELMGKLPTQGLSGDDYPVVNITWWSAITFANKLSQKNNLPPAYDFSYIGEWTGEAALGTLKPKNEKLAKLSMKFLSIPKDIYHAKGFRLPTIYESIYVSSDRGRSNTKMFTNIDEKNLHQYASFDLPNRLMLPVTSRLPFTIDQKLFYDLYGNVSEWLHDRGTHGSQRLSEGINPIDINENPDLYQTRLFRMNYSATALEEMNSFNFADLDPSDTNPLVGFRLVRSLD